VSLEEPSESKERAKGDRDPSTRIFGANAFGHRLTRVKGWPANDTEKWDRGTLEVAVESGLKHTLAAQRESDSRMCWIPCSISLTRAGRDG
jgi:hypothetical protein